MSMSVKDKVALVTGANRGIGKAIVEELLEQGAKKVYAGARKTESLDELVQKYEDRVVPVELDVTDADQVAKAAETAKDVDIIVNNAGHAVPGDFTNGGLLEGLHKNLETNLMGVASLTEAMLPVLREKDAAAVAVVSSVAGLSNMSMMLSYSVSKAAVHSLTQGLRAELKDTEISVTGVYPGPIDTDMAKGFDIQKESPENVAKDVVAGIENGDAYVFPDPMSKQVGEGFMSSPLAVEEQFANFTI